MDGALVPDGEDITRGLEKLEAGAEHQGEGGSLSLSCNIVRLDLSLLNH